MFLKFIRKFINCSGPRVSSKLRVCSCVYACVSLCDRQCISEHLWVTECVKMSRFAALAFILRRSAGWVSTRGGRAACGGRGWWHTFRQTPISALLTCWSLCSLEQTGSPHKSHCATDTHVSPLPPSPTSISIWMTFTAGLILYVAKI